MNRQRLSIRGFTLIEMMVTLAVMVVLAMIAVPAFHNLTRRGQVARASNTLLADLDYARMEAVNRGLIVSLCPSTDGVTCQTTTTYDTGWMIYTYVPGKAVANTKYDSTSSNNVLLRYTQALAGVSITGTDNSTNNDVISFNSQGQQPTTSAIKLNFVTCYRDAGTSVGASTAVAPGAQLTLSTSGSASTVPVAAGGSCTAS
jgi:type IV fimbrial biogenesis protein FimT